MMQIKRRIVEVLDLIRRISGDDAYDRYVEHHRQCHANQPPLNRRAFYLAEQQRKWSGIKRCC